MSFIETDKRHPIMWRKKINQIKSPLITADKPDVTASYTSQEVTTSLSALYPKPHPFTHKLGYLDIRLG